MNGHYPQPSTPAIAGHFEHLEPAECLELLGAKKVGRVAYCDAQTPGVLPVNYALRDQSIVFRTAAGSRLARHMKDTRVAFQVDEIDDFLQAGWSVLVVGVAHWVTDAEEIADLWWDQHQPQPWADGERNAFVRIVPSAITGRRVYPT
jgi:nitroimidazol reductase NimA-like FMN-containing flavoprotein (pyridoxamine 5'-phosphate oxidase superfamily)